MSCLKYSYSSKKDAEWASKRIKKQGAITARESLIPYYCDLCVAWHLSKTDAVGFLNKVVKNVLKKSKRRRK